MSCTISNSNWTSFFSSNIILNQTYMNLCWPGIAYQDLAQLAFKRNLTQGQWLNVLSCVLCPLGIVANIFCTAAIWRKAIKEKERFYIWMLVNTWADILFCAVTFPLKLGITGMYPIIFSYSFGAALSYRLLIGTWRAGQSISDLVALAITAERCLAITRPTQTVTEFQTKVLTCIEIFVIIVLSGVRFCRWSFENVVTQHPNGNWGYTGASWATTDWFAGLKLAMDFGLTAVILAFMVLFTLLIGLAVFKRRRSRVHNSASFQQQQQINNQSWAILRLLIVIVLMYMFNQVSFSFYALALYLGKGFDSLTIDNMTYDQVNYRINIGLLWDISADAALISDILSRSVNVFLYYVFSPTFRQEFKYVLYS